VQTTADPAVATLPFADPRWQRAAVALLIALGLSLALTLASGSGAGTAAGRVGGDYPSFYAAGRIARADDYDQLHDPARLEAEESNLGIHDGYIAFPYPPHVALAYEPFTLVGYRLSYALHTALMLGALVFALYLLRPMVPTVDRRFVVVVALACAFFPMFRALGGGQNTALTLLLLAGSWRAVYEDRPALAGVLLGLQLFKPQVALLFLLLHVLDRRWKLVAAFCATGAVTWIVCAAVAGAGWVGDWAHSLSAYARLEAHSNATNAVSFPSVADTVFGYGTTAARGVGYALAAIALVVVAHVWRRGDLAVGMAAAAVGTLLVSPHAVYYDAGLAVIAGLVLVDRGGRGHRIAAAVLWVLAASHVLADTIGLDPVVFVLAATLIAVATLPRRPSGLLRGAA
jgi:Glycosyltransferase family 87